MEKDGVFLEVTENYKCTADRACLGVLCLLLLARQGVAMSSQEVLYQRPGLVDRLPASILNLPWLGKEIGERQSW